MIRYWPSGLGQTRRRFGTGRRPFGDLSYFGPFRADSSVCPLLNSNAPSAAPLIPPFVPLVS